MIEEGTSIDPAPVALPTARANRPVRFSHYVEYATFRALLGFFRLLGIDNSSALAGKFLRYLGPCLRPISKRAEHNLTLIYPSWSRARIRSVTADLWENLGRTAGEFAHLDKIDIAPPHPHVDIIGREKLDAIATSTTPVIFVTGHFANWEIPPIALQAAGVKYAFIFRAANNPLTDEYIINHRAKVMSRHQIPKGKRGGRTLVDTLKSGRSVLMLVDQKLNTGIPVPFLGQPAMTAPAAARLSLKYQAPLVPLSFERTDGARFQLTVQDALEFTPTGNTSSDIEALTRKINETLGEVIHARPEQWLWFHRRWRKKKNAQK